MARCKLPNHAGLTRDPVFQVNACLWLVFKSPALSEVPSYNSAGFLLRALGKKLGISPTLRARLVALAWRPEPPSPDVLFRHVPSHKHLVLECKASSFSASSTTAQQARKLLTLCGDPNAALGVTASAIVVYVLPVEDTSLQLETLRELASELSDLKLEPIADSGVMGLSIEDDGLWATLILLASGGHAELRPVEGRVRINDGVQGEARPLYLIPYDPAAADNQSRAELEYCTQQLVERILNFATSVVGRSEVPNIVCIDPAEAMKQATFGASDYWQANDVATLRKKIEDQIFRTLNRGELQGKVERVGKKVDITLADHDDQRIAVSLLQKSSPSAVARQVMDSQLAFETE